jgi:hypothetical protein
MSELRVTNIVGEDGVSSPTFTRGINVTGVITATTLNQVVSGIITATTFDGNLQGNVNGNVTGNATSATVANGLGASASVNTTGIITASSFSGALTGNAATATSATNLTGAGSTAQVLGVNTGSLNGTKLYLSGNAAAEIVTLSDGANIIPDFTTGNNFEVTLAGNRTLNNPTGVTTGQSGVIFVKQDGTGSRTLGVQTHWQFAGGTAPTFTTTANAVDVIGYVVYGPYNIACTTTLDVKATS